MIVRGKEGGKKREREGGKGRERGREGGEKGEGERENVLVY